MSKLRKSARGKPCCLQLHPFCNGNPETVVLCHLPSLSKGIALKPPDWMAVYGCSSCHDLIDGRVRHDLPKEEIMRSMLRALERTWRLMIDEGLITVR